MQQPYHNILTLSINHKYFTDNMIESFSLSLPDDTLRLLKNLGIVIKQFKGGLHILASQTELFDSFDDNTLLQFYVNPTDNLFCNYTDLPGYDLSSNLLYFNNLNASSLSDGKDFLLHTETFVNEKNVTKLCGQRIDLSSFNPKEEISFSNALGEEIENLAIAQSNNLNLDLDIHHFPEGLLYVTVDGNESIKLYKSDNTIWKKPIAICEIYLGTLFSQYQTKGKIDYHIQFNNRKTTWKYFLVDPVFKKFKNLSIINKDKEQVFNEPLPHSFPDNSEGFVFVSKHSIPLSNYKQPVFQLFDDFNPAMKTGKLILKNMPSPTAEMLFNDNTDNDKVFYSHIYI